MRRDQTYLMYSLEIERMKRQLKLTSRQKEILLGKLLGDGHLETRDNGKTYRLKIEQSKQQKSYVDWMQSEFKEWVRTPAQLKEQKQLYHGEERTYYKYWFNTLSSGAFRFYAQQFYRNGKKEVPKAIYKWFTPLVLAVWYMDDGSIKSKTHRTVFLNTQGFDYKSIQYLQEALWKKFVVKTTIRKQRDGMQIYIPSESVDLFLTTISPFVLPSMRYKLPKVWLTHMPKR